MLSLLDSSALFAESRLSPVISTAHGAPSWPGGFHPSTLWCPTGRCGPVEPF